MGLSELRERLRHFSPRERLRRNMGLRILSLLLAIGLWVFVNAGHHDAETSLQVPISYQELPTGMLILNPRPHFVKLEVLGPPTLLSLLDPGRLTLRLDLTGVSAGQASFKITPGMFAVPRQTSIIRISPSQIVLDIDRIVTRNVPVHLNIKGKVAKGYAIATIELEPAEVKVAGPSTLVSRIIQLNTAPLDVRGAISDIKRTVELVNPSDKVQVAAQAVQAAVTLQEVIADREFRNVPIDVRDSNFKYKVEPSHATVTLRGPVLKLAGLSLKGAVFIDADGIAPGWHDLPIQINLPDGVELVRQVPEKVRLRMYREKRAGNG
jgi:YbbR domain-containing protein